MRYTIRFYSIVCTLIFAVCMLSIQSIHAVETGLSILWENVDVTPDQGGIGVKVSINDSDPGLKALWGVDNKPNTLDYVKINGISAQELKSNGKIARMYTYGDIVGFHMDAPDFQPSDVNMIEFLPGFTVYSHTSDSWGADNSASYFAVDDGILQDYVALRKIGDTWVKQLLLDGDVLADDAFVIAATKNNYIKGDSLDLSTVSLTVKYQDDPTNEVTIPITNAMVSYDFSTSGTKNVIVSYNGYQKSFEVEVADTALIPHAILVTQNVSGSANLGYTYDFDGLEVKLQWFDTETNQVSDVLTNINLSELSISGLNVFSLGMQTVTLSYNTLTTTIDVLVEDLSPGEYFYIDALNDSVTVGPGNTLAVGIGVTDNIQDNLKSLWGLEHKDYTAEYIKINGILVSELINQGLIARIYSYGEVLGFHMDNPNFQPAQVETIEFLKGFVMYTADNNSWGADNSSSYYALEGAILKSNVSYKQVEGKWVQLLKLDGTSLASDALVVENTKTTYFEGQSIDLDALTLKVKYHDNPNDEVTVAVTAQMISYDFSTVGTQTVTISYNGYQTTFEVEVEETQLEPHMLIVESNVSEHATLGLPYDYEGLVVKMQWINPVTSEISSELTSILLNEIVFTGLDIYLEGIQTVTLEYAGLTTTIEVDVVDSHSNVYANIIMDIDKERSGLTIKYTIENSDAQLRALWFIDKKDNVSDRIKINGILVSDLIEQGLITRMYIYGTTLGFHMDNPSFQPSDVTIIEFLEGFQFYTSNADSWGSDNSANYQAIPGGFVREYVAFQYLNGNWVRQVKLDENYELASDGLTVTTTKSVYGINENIDLSTIILKVKYHDDPSTEVVVPLEASMLSYDFSQSGMASVTITFQGYEVILEGIEISDLKPHELIIESGVTANAYIGEVYDYHGLVLKMRWFNETTQTVEEELTDVNLSSVVFSGLNIYTAGTQTVTVTFAGLSATFEVVVIDEHDNQYLNIQVSGYSIYENTIHHSMLVITNLVGIDTSLKAIINVEQKANVLDKILINGILATELYEQGLLSGIRIYGSQILFSLDRELQPNQEAYDWAKQRDPELAEYFDTHPFVQIETVTFLPGFQLYTADQDYWPGTTPNYWGNYTPVVNGYLKEKVTLENYFGLRWIRPFAETDGLIIESLPEKTEYLVGEYLDINGLIIQANYQDGGRETTTVSDSWVSGFDPFQIGEQTLTITFNGGTVTFKVNVLEEVIVEPETPNGLTTTQIILIVVASVLVVGGLGVGSFIIIKKIKK